MKDLNDRELMRLHLVTAFGDGNVRDGTIDNILKDFTQKSNIATTPVTFENDPDSLRAELYRRIYSNKIICTRCNDSHVMPYSGNMCTLCPSPCSRCRKDGNGSYCTKTPCICYCHKKHHQYRQIHFLDCYKHKWHGITTSASYEYCLYCPAGRNIVTGEISMAHDNIYYGLR